MSRLSDWYEARVVARALAPKDAPPEPHYMPEWDGEVLTFNVWPSEADAEDARRRSEATERQEP